jgi:putative addiction module killer protein
MTIAVREYLDARASPSWLNGLLIYALAAAKVATALYRLEQGNFSRVEGVGGGVYECKINFCSGYRVYFGKDGESLIILLGGGSKRNSHRAGCARRKTAATGRPIILAGRSIRGGNAGK